MADYADIIDAPDLKYKPQVNEYEFNPFLLQDPTFRKLRSHEAEHGIVNMSTVFGAFFMSMVCSLTSV